MPDTVESLKIRILTAFLRMSENSCTVTNLARTFGTEKYTISRAMTALEKDGMIDRSDARHPKLCKRGEEAAKKYAERIDVATNHLLYEGVGENQACTDAMYLSMYCSDETFEVIKTMEEQCRVKHLLRNRQEFDGDLLCRQLKDGEYRQPFMMYRENVKNGSNISMANDAFVHPCSLSVQDGKGIIHLTAQRVERISGATGKKMSGRIQKLKYYDGQKFNDASQNGNVISFPADAMHFLNIGSDSGRIFHGSVCLKMTCSVGPVHMPESKAIFILLF